jgi:DNA-binding SARP family transcriptional activator
MASVRDGAAIRYGILGPVELRVAGRERPIDGPRQLALLACLLVHANRAMSKDELIDALWRTSRPDGSVKRLQMAVARLRRTLDPGAGRDSPLHTVASGYLLTVAPGELDADVFRAQAQEGRRALDAGEPERARTVLREALALWRGPALAEVAYESFAQAEIRRLDELRLTALEARIQADLDVGRHAALIGELAALAAEHPARERLTEQLMVAYCRCGRQAEALDAYQRTRVRLDAELGLEPGPALKALQREILNQAPRLAPVRPRRPDAVAGPERRLPRVRACIGRDADRARLREWIGAARGGSGRAVLLGGEPGVGKTTLATYAALSAHEAGFTVAYGASARDLSPPYGTWIGPLTDLAEHAPPELLAAHVAQDGSELSRLVRSLEQLVPLLPPLRKSDPETELYLLFAAVAGLLRRLSAHRPLALLLDDLQWADKQSLALLHRVAATAAEIPLLVLGTYRDSDLAPGHPLAGMLADLRRVPGVERIDVGGLGVDEVAELMEDRLGQEVGAAGRRLAEEIADETGGNPFFAGEILSHLRQSGKLARDRNGRWRLPATIADLGVPASVREVVEHRVRSLGEPVERALRSAAVIGGEFDLELLERILDERDEELLAALEAAIAAHVIVETPDRPGRFAFAHALINHTLYATAGATRRSRLHRRAAEALEELADRRRTARGQGGRLCAAGRRARARAACARRRPAPLRAGRAHAPAGEPGHGRALRHPARARRGEAPARRHDVRAQPARGRPDRPPPRRSRPPDACGARQHARAVRRGGRARSPARRGHRAGPRRGAGRLAAPPAHARGPRQGALLRR